MTWKLTMADGVTKAWAKRSQKGHHCPSEARTHDLPMTLKITVGRCNQLSHGADSFCALSSRQVGRRAAREKRRAVSLFEPEHARSIKAPHSPPASGSNASDGGKSWFACCVQVCATVTAARLNAKGRQFEAHSRTRSAPSAVPQEAEGKVCGGWWFSVGCWRCQRYSAVRMN